MFLCWPASTSGPLTPYDLLNKGSHMLQIKECGGWSDYISKHMKTGSVNDREHAAFLNMLLKKFIFCGSSCGPTTNHQYLVEWLAAGNVIPHRKYLLGSAYSLMHQVSMKLLKDEPIGTISGPWWLIQLWLHLHMHQVSGSSLKNQIFPSSDFLEKEKERTRRCTSSVRKHRLSPF